jgi:hypothetical protein
LLIPKSEGRDEDIINGFKVAQTVAKQGWLAPIIGLSAYTAQNDVQAKKAFLLQSEFETKGRPVFSDFLEKGELFDPNPSKQHLAPAKLRRHLIPLFRYVELAGGFPSPTFFIGEAMLRILRQFVELSRLRDDGWRFLPKMLLLGDPGCGKTHLAYTYHQLLHQRDIDQSVASIRPRIPETINCASLAASDLSGQVELFGVSQGPRSRAGARIGNFVNQRGRFERATVYNGVAQDHLAPTDAVPVYNQGGVVFLDEFANLDLGLQASVLNTVEEGWVRRVIDGSRVDIGCHIVCATNVDPTQAVRSPSELSYTDTRALRMRSDLIDRIPYVIRVPSLRERDETEILALLRQFAIRSSGALVVNVTHSAREILRAAIQEGIVASIRHLQTIAKLEPGEDIISDGNLRWVIEKGHILKQKSLIGLAAQKEKLSLTEKARKIGLPGWLCRDDLPEWTAWAVERLYDVQVGQAQTPNFKESAFQTPDGQEKQWRYWLLSTYITDVENLYRAKSHTLNTRRNEARRAFDFNEDARKMIAADLGQFDQGVLLSNSRRAKSPSSQRGPRK